jgi:hypothetical protein
MLGKHATGKMGLNNLLAGYSSTLPALADGGRIFRHMVPNAISVLHFPVPGNPFTPQKLKMPSL